MVMRILDDALMIGLYRVDGFRGGLCVFTKNLPKRPAFKFRAIGRVSFSG